MQSWQLNSLLKFSTAIVLMSESVVLFFLLRLDPDPYHDGYMYAGAIAVRDGLLPNKNFLTPYGPVGPILQGLWLKFTPASLLDLRIFNLILIVSIGYLIQRNLKPYSNYAVAVLMNLTWVFTLAGRMPWPSIISTFFILLIITIIKENIAELSNKRKSKHLYLYSVIGLLYLSVFTRIQLVLVIITFTIFLIFKRKSLSTNLFRVWLQGNIIFAALSYILLQSFGVLPGFIEQVIKWASETYVPVEVDLAFIVSFFWFPFAAIFAIMLVGGVYFLLIKYRKTREHYLVTVLLFLFLISLFLSNIRRDGLLSLRNPKIFLIDASTVIMNFVGYSVIPIAIFFLLFSGNKEIRYLFWDKNRIEETNFNFLLLLVANVTLFQLYPLQDRIHIWFISPLILLPVVILLLQLAVFDHRVLMKSISYVLLGLLGSLFTQSVIELSKPREFFQSTSLQGMLGTPKSVLDIDTRMKALDNLFPKRMLRNNCPLGLYAVSERQFNSIDGIFAVYEQPERINWYPVVDPKPYEPRFIFSCNLTAKEAESIRESEGQILFDSNTGSTYDPMGSYDLLYENKK
jgi:hypothetical protein